MPDGVLSVQLKGMIAEPIDYAILRAGELTFCCFLLARAGEVLRVKFRNI